MRKINLMNEASRNADGWQLTSPTTYSHISV